MTLAMSRADPEAESPDHPETQCWRLCLSSKQTNGCSGVAPWFGGVPASGCDTRRAIVGA
ncbi:hypothetical protein N7522_008583 [Penicillium canescens]|nr:hypothetical protein N7522_008583 [Penicillium canescens]